MLTKEQFYALGEPERLWLIYSSLPKSTAPGESPIAGIFNKTDTVTPVQKFPIPPAGFEDVFGPYPEKADYNSPERNIYENRVKRWGGVYNLSNLPEYFNKVKKAELNKLGHPIGYVFDGNVFVTFSVLEGQNWYRDLSQYMDHYDDVVNAANLFARQKGLI